MERDDKREKPRGNGEGEKREMPRIHAQPRQQQNSVKGRPTIHSYTTAD